MNIYEQVDKLINSDEERPKWADEILHELKEIKTALKENQNKRPRDKAYFKFVNDLRVKLKASVDNDNYPEIYYQDRVLGINFKGWIYDKENTKVLPSHEAYKVYKFLYNQKENINNFIKT